LLRGGGEEGGKNANREKVPDLSKARAGELFPEEPDLFPGRAPSPATLQAQPCTSVDLRDESPEKGAGLSTACGGEE
jgi:hypothetical protein